MNRVVLWASILSLFLLAACRGDTQAPEPWHQARPSWMNIPQRAPSEQLAAFTALTDGLMAVRISDPAPSTPVPPNIAEAARVIVERLPEVRWTEEIRQGARDVASGRLRLVRVSAIEPSSELIATSIPYPMYDGVHDRIVYQQLGESPLIVRANLVYALAERAHLHHLAWLASVPARTYALTLRVCGNLRGEFRLVTYLQAIRAMASWVLADPDLGPENEFTRLNGRIIRSPQHVASYRSLDSFLSSTLPRDTQERLVAEDAFNRAETIHLTHIEEMCGRYVISRGPRRGSYLLPWDNVAEVSPYLWHIHRINTPPSR